MKTELLAFADQIEQQVKTNPPPVVDNHNWEFKMEGTNYKVSCASLVKSALEMVARIRKSAGRELHSSEYRASQYTVPTVSRSGRSGLEALLKDNDIANAIPLAQAMGETIYLWTVPVYNKGKIYVLANSVSQYPDHDDFIVCKGQSCNSWSVMHKVLCVALCGGGRSKQRAIESARKDITRMGEGELDKTIASSLKREDTPRHIPELAKAIALVNPQPSEAVAPVVAVVVPKPKPQPLALSLTATQIINAIGAMK